MNLILENKVCLVSGATSGIGRETALGLAKLGGNTVIVARNHEKGEVTKEWMTKKTGNSSIEILVADLSIQANVKAAAEAFSRKYDHLDVLVNNAGVYMAKRQITTDGIEMTFAVNHLGYYMLTLLLLKQLRAADSARVVNVSSGAHYGVRTTFDDINFEKRKFSGYLAYRESKLANILFTLELANRLQNGIKVNCLHPGVVRTHLARSRGIFGKFWRYSPFFADAGKGARSSIYLASSTDIDVSGKYFSNRKEQNPSRAARDAELQKHLWNISENLTGITFR